MAGCGGAAVGERDDVVIVVFVAASLRDALTELADAFEAGRPGVEVVANAAGSQQLAAQILDGAPAHLFVSADEHQIARVADAGLLRGAPAPFAETVLAIAVAPGNPHGVERLADLGRPDLLVVLAEPSVPAGRYAHAALDAAGVDVRPVSEELDVRAVLSKVALGEADAGLVYATDVLAAGDRVEAVPVAPTVVVRSYTGVLEGAPAIAEDFLAFARGTEGRAILGRWGLARHALPKQAATPSGRRA